VAPGRLTSEDMELDNPSLDVYGGGMKVSTKLEHRRSMTTIESPVYFDRLAEIEAGHWWSLGMWRLASYWLDAALAGRSGLQALDVGCGTGMTALRLANRPEIRDVIGLDPSPQALMHARRRHALPLIRGSALALPFDDRQFDVATCFDVVQHLSAGGDRRAAGELHRVLRPGGMAVVRSNGRGWSRDSSAYRLAILVDMLGESGFTIRRASYANSLPALAQELRGRLARAGGPPSHPSGGGLRIRLPHPAVNRLMTGVSGAEAWLAGRLGVRLPFGHSTLVLAERAG
jgi:SAM-dependent methyltransferase